MIIHILAFSALMGLISVISADKKLFCYYSSFAQYREGLAKFLPEDIDPFLCTHVIFAFVDITPDGKRLMAAHSGDEGPGGMYERAMKLREKNPSLKILLAVGGWHAGSKPFIPVVYNDNTRKTWTQNVITFVRSRRFDGLDMDWEFPGTRGSAPEDKHRFTLLMKELYDAFAEESRRNGRPKLLLTMATAAGTYYIDQAYETDQITKYVDFMLLMTYNYHGSWDKVVGHHSGLHIHPKDDIQSSVAQLNQDWTIQYWLKAGLPKNKMVVGIPTYGVTLNLMNPKEYRMYAPINGAGTGGQYTKEPGILAYYEICQNINKEGWREEWNRPQEVPFAHKGNQWVGFENHRSVKAKVQNINDQGLAGAFIWSLEMDDFSGSCGMGKYPLLSTINKNLKGSNGMISQAASGKEVRRVSKQKHTQLASRDDSSKNKLWWKQPTSSPDRQWARKDQGWNKKSVKKELLPWTRAPRAKKEGRKRGLRKKTKAKKQWTPKSRKRTQSTTTKTWIRTSRTPKPKQWTNQATQDWSPMETETLTTKKAEAWTPKKTKTRTTRKTHKWSAKQTQKWSPKETHKWSSKMQTWSPRKVKAQNRSISTGYFQERTTGDPATESTTELTPETEKPKPKWVRSKTTWTAQPDLVENDWTDDTNDNAIDHDKETVTYYPIPSTVKAPDDIIHICRMRRAGTFIDPSSCRHYFMCYPTSIGIFSPMRMECPGGTRYDDHLKICNFMRTFDC